MIITDRLDLANMLAIDPGNDKTGIALLSQEGLLVARAIIKTVSFDQEVSKVLAMCPGIESVVCGNGTNHRRLYPQVQDLAKSRNLPCYLADEAHTTEEAKKFYWVLHPPKGLKRLLPKGMLVPPEPVDDITAYVIGKRWLAHERTREKE